MLYEVITVAIVYPIYQSQTGVVGNGQVQSKEIARLGRNNFV